MDSVCGAELHNVLVGVGRLKGKAFKAVDADSSGVTDDRVVTWIRNIVGIGTEKIL